MTQINAEQWRQRLSPTNRKIAGSGRILPADSRWTRGYMIEECIC